MKRDEIDKLRELPIEGVALHLGLKLSGHKTLCVNHLERHMSLHFSQKKNRGKCFSCGWTCDSISLVEKVKGVGFLDACKWLAEEYNLIISGLHFEERKTAMKERIAEVDVGYLESLMERPRITSLARRFLVEERHISEDVIRQIGISSIDRDITMNGKMDGQWYNAPALLLPYRDAAGYLLNVQARYMGSENKPRFQFPKGSMCSIFNMPQVTALGENDTLFISEGPTDCLALLSSGRKAIGIASATTLTYEDKKLLKDLLPKTTTLACYPDNDKAGETLYEGLVKMANDIGVCIVRHRIPEGCKDFGEAWRNIDHRLTQIKSQRLGRLKN